eukprot:CAMPEP_0184689050 /NCGR_PEP_ID=MMETSP0312-20130426/30434_1 /TAXON_ID=31354 /ORGANISM="Compsopogon coeruleus, Strain SAG 36.94" /LENGTH=2036 /DNA_ID=CAMNT_0027146347 /DNA_START=395 /DNA_END=6502 /DNA_ORIENTATION=-
MPKSALGMDFGEASHEDRFRNNVSWDEDVYDEDSADEGLDEMDFGLEDAAVVKFGVDRGWMEKLTEAKEDRNGHGHRGASGSQSRSKTSGAGTRVILDVDWLLQRCGDCVAACGMTPLEMARAVVIHVESSSSEEELQAGLFELVGEFDVVADIIQKKDFIKTKAKSMMNQIEQMASNGQLRQTEDSTRSPRQNLGGPSERFSVVSMAEKREQKGRRKKNQCSRDSTSVETDGLERAGSKSCNEQSPLERMEAIAKALRSAGAPVSTDTLGPDRYSLPLGTERKVYKGYEEYTVPPSQSIPSRRSRRLDIQSCMDDLGKIVFRGVESLNAIQSAVFEKAYGTNENLLICAPTGAGKTNIALLTILRELRQHAQDGVVDTSKFKVVYIAPMKALAAEVCDKFSERLKPLNILVRELTGDTQLTRQEAQATQVIVTTPEKWDVITRKAVPGSGNALTELVKLLIVDEIHLLHDDRGAVLESIVARTLRTVEAKQTMIRLVGLSATLPNYKDVAAFLRANESSGLFHFDQSFRPVPLSQRFIGVTEKDSKKKDALFTRICYDKVAHSIREGHQAMVFVHTRKGTVSTARDLLDLSTEEQTEESCVFLPRQQVGKKAKKKAVHEIEYLEDGPRAAVPKIPDWAEQVIAKAKSSEIRELCIRGVGIHHAGLLRSDRKIVEHLFGEGVLRCLVCTATLAWGVNLPARTVVIKGTEIYDPTRGGFVDIGMLDVMQIFGRAGRPQFDTEGEGIIITAHDKLSFYLRFLTSSLPVESRLTKNSALVDHLNAEVVLGTISNVREGAEWLGYTFLKVRMAKNPLVYGIDWEFAHVDPELLDKRREMIETAAAKLDDARMVRYDPETGSLGPTDLGRVASHYYVSLQTIEHWSEVLKPSTDESGILKAVCNASEFEQLRLRDEETDEICNLVSLACPFEVRGGVDSDGGKINVLLQTYISRARVQSFTLISDSNFVQQNASRMLQAVFEIALKKGWPSLSLMALELCRAADRQVWSFQNPLRQVPRLVQVEVVARLESLGRTGELENLLTLSHSELVSLVRSPKVAMSLQYALSAIPILEVEATISPLTKTVLRINVKLKPAFRWIDSVHGSGSSSLRWHLWIEDCDQDRIYHYERISIAKKNMSETLDLVLLVPVFDPPSPQYSVRVLNATWQGGDSYFDISLRDVIFPDRYTKHTPLLELQPLPRSALKNSKAELIYRFSHFNPVQTQIFHCLYHQNGNVLVGAPTGSGKTVAAELAALRSFREEPRGLVVYIGPLKALIRERISDWRTKMESTLEKHIVELTGDVNPEPGRLEKADIICTTPEKWDGISRGWQYRPFVQRLSLLILDEVHLLGADRGPVLEIIVSRVRRVNAKCRIVALSTALANASELADWLAIDQKVGLFNFRPSVRPVPCEAHVIGVAGDLYCPRMNAMNRPAFSAICRYSPSKPTLVFVSSRRQTRLTAMELIRLAAIEGNPRRFNRDPDADYGLLADQVIDSSLRQVIEFGVGIHHAGLPPSDRALVEAMYLEGKLMILVSTSTLAWGVNLPAHLVVIKGTEFYDGKQKKYVDMPITDILQMMGRAGRPQFDSRAYAVILVQDSKKTFYKKFLYDPFPVESSLHLQLHDHINAEISSGTVRSAQDALDFLTWTYLFRRVASNPTYYGARDNTADGLSSYFSGLIEDVLVDLKKSGCIVVSERFADIADMETIENERRLEPQTASSSKELVKSLSSHKLKSLLLESTALGTIASTYYLSHHTVRFFENSIRRDSSIENLLRILTECHEFEALPVRHNEDKLNEELSRVVIDSILAHSTERSEQEVRKSYGLFPENMGSPHVKARLLLLSHMKNLPLPIVDYHTDTRSALDNAARILQSMIDISSERGYLGTVERCVSLGQHLAQGLSPGESSLGCLGELSDDLVHALLSNGVSDLQGLSQLNDEQIRLIAGRNPALIAVLSNLLSRIPRVSIVSAILRRSPLRRNSWETNFSLRATRRAPIPGEPERAPGAAITKSAFAKDYHPETWYAAVGDPIRDELYAMVRLPPLKSW